MTNFDLFFFPFLFHPNITKSFIYLFCWIKIVKNKMIRKVLKPSVLLEYHDSIYLYI